MNDEEIEKLVNEFKHWTDYKMKLWGEKPEDFYHNIKEHIEKSLNGDINSLFFLIEKAKYIGTLEEKCEN